MVNKLQLPGKIDIHINVHRNADYLMRFGKEIFSKSNKNKICTKSKKRGAKKLNSNEANFK